MKRIIWFTAIVLLFTSWVTVWPVVGNETGDVVSQSGNAYMTAFPIVEFANAQPRNIVVESTNKAWFTAPGANAIGSLIVSSPTVYTFEFFPVPTTNSEPYDLAYAANTVWFTQRNGNKIGRLNTTTGDVIEYNVPTSGSAPTGIAVAPNGMVWYVGKNGNQFGRLNPATGVIDEFVYTTANAQFEDLAVQADGLVVATSPTLDSTVSFNPVSGNFFRWIIEPGAAPYHIAMDGSTPWVSAPGINMVARQTLGTLTFWRLYRTHTVNNDLRGLALSKANGLIYAWFTQPQASKVGLIVINSDGQAQFYWQQELPTANSQPEGLATDAAGSVWIAAKGSNEIVRWTSPHFDLQSLYLPVTMKLFD
jgi:virginiamycin B lyase